MFRGSLGTPIAVTGANKALIQTNEYEPYGQLLNRTLTDGPGFTGHVQDALTGLTYMQQRYYDQGIGRFLSTDPVTADATTGNNFNRYKYANNNPYRFADPDGRQVSEPHSCHSDGSCVSLDQAQASIGGDGRLLLGLVGGAALAGGGAAVLAPEAVGGGGLLAAAKSFLGFGGKESSKEIISRLTKGAVKDDVKGGVRQVVKTGGEKQMGRDMVRASKGARTTNPVKTTKGIVRTAEHADGTTVSSRNFSGDGRPTIQVNSPEVDEVIKVRYDP